MIASSRSALSRILLRRNVASTTASAAALHTRTVAAAAAPASHHNTMLRSYSKKVKKEENDDEEEDGEKELAVAPAASLATLAPPSLQSNRSATSATEQQQVEEVVEEVKFVDTLERKPRIAMLVAGCGQLDGVDPAEVAVLNILLHDSGVELTHFAPFGTLDDVYNHATRELDTREERTFQKEAARLTRGNLHNVQKLNPANFDALVIPGGYGWARNTSNLEKEHTDLQDFECNADLHDAIKRFIQDGKPIFTVSTGIVPVGIVVGKKLGGVGLSTYTLGKDSTYGEYLELLGNAPDRDIPIAQFAYDANLNVYSTPGGAASATTGPEHIYRALRKYCDKLLEVVAAKIGKK